MAAFKGMAAFKELVRVSGSGSKRYFVHSQKAINTKLCDAVEKLEIWRFFL